MGNTVTWLVRRTSSESPGRSGRLGKAPVGRSADHVFSRGGGLEGLRLDGYKCQKPVEDAQGVRSVPAALQSYGETAPGKTILRRSVSPVVSDFTVPTREEDELLEEAGRSPLQADAVEARRSPVYSDWLPSARKRDSKLGSLDVEVKLIEKRISEFAEVSEVKPGENLDKTHMLLPQTGLIPAEKKDLLGPFAPLTHKEENAVNLALQDPYKFLLHKYEVLVLHESSRIEITREVIRCLSQGFWLNDEVINLYFELLKEREKREPTKFLKCHFFNTFFYKKLTSGRNGYDFEAVRRWTTLRKLGYGLTECDKIFVPIHRERHWCLAVIDVKNEKLSYLDSLGGKDEHVLKVLGTYIVDEVKDKTNKTINITSWTQEAVDNLPRQKNGWDCGMFMLKYADFISRGLSLCFHQDNMIYFRKRTAKEILSLRAE